MEEAEKDEYELLEAIGSGSFGVIRKVRRKADGRILARKEIDYRKMSTQEKEQLVAEVNILKDLKHPNIVEFLERVIDRENCFIYILMEYCEGGDLASVIQRHKENRVPIPEEFVWELMTQLIMALHECHYGVIVDPETKKTTPRPILHRDLKPDNVFLDAKKNVKLGDFGLSRTLNNPQKAFAQTYVGTPYYMSPELISSSLYDARSDIWSLGCVVFEMCALQPPFLADTLPQLTAKIKLGSVRALPSSYSPELNQIIREMLQVDPRRRPTTKELLAIHKIMNIGIQLELRRKSSELDRISRSLKEKDDRLVAKENDLYTREERVRNAEKTIRDQEALLEEQFRQREQVLLQEEQKLLQEQATIEDQWRRLSHERERLEATRERSTKSPFLPTRPQFDARLEARQGVAEDTRLQRHSMGVPSKPGLFSGSKPFLPAAPQTSLGITSRRKTGLSLGRYPLHPSTSFQSGSGQDAKEFSVKSSQADTSYSSSRGGVLQKQQPQQQQQLVQPNGSSNDSSKPSEGTSTLQDKSGTNGFGGFTAAPRLGLGSGNHSKPVRSRLKSKSTSTLAASLSSTSISVPASATASLNNPFLVTSSTQASASLARPASNHTSSVPSSSLPPTSSPLHPPEPDDIQMGETLSTQSQSSFFHPSSRHTPPSQPSQLNAFPLDGRTTPTKEWDPDLELPSPFIKSKFTKRM
ncbi:G2-specific serine/threonine protein kinase [Mortierella antarctica]|nr:G2-specific serine/threonine protein kinase [Mortierella antarctica]